MLEMKTASSAARTTLVWVLEKSGREGRAVMKRLKDWECPGDAGVSGTKTTGRVVRFSLTGVHTENAAGVVNADAASTSILANIVAKCRQLKFVRVEFRRANNALLSGLT